MKNQQMNRDSFMAFFRDDNMLNMLSSDDRIEVFMSILTGSSDLTKENIDALLSDYSVPNLQIIEVEQC